MSRPYFEQIRAPSGREISLMRIIPLEFQRVSMTATVQTLPPTNEINEIIDFLRRLASMLSGGHNAEMLLVAAKMIEELSGRATTVGQRLQEQQEDNSRNLELREVAELASYNLVAEVNSLKAQLAESEAKAETERNYFAEESRRLAALADEARGVVAESNDRLLRVNAEIDVLRNESLQLARTQFGYLAQGFAKNGDVVSQTICEIGARAIDKALAGDKSAN
jgi:predicted ABC-type transport system involved in lysophospholipase L1 biosynthesis ATPase subunit